MAASSTEPVMDISRRRCVVASCRREAVHGKRILHPFPEDKLLRHLWGHFVSSTDTPWEGPNKSTFLCSDHFSTKAYTNWADWKEGRDPHPKLKSHYVPTISKPTPREPSEPTIPHESLVSRNLDYSSVLMDMNSPGDSGDDQRSRDGDEATNHGPSTSTAQPGLDVSLIKQEHCEEEDTQGTSSVLLSLDMLPERRTKVTSLVNMMEKRDEIMKRQEDRNIRNRFARAQKRRRNSLYLRQLTPYFKKKHQDARDRTSQLQSQVNRAATNEVQLYCLCRSSDTSQFMITCYHCNKQYHGRCVGVEEQAAQFIARYACPPCRDKDPTLSIIYDYPARGEQDKQDQETGAGMDIIDEDKQVLPVQFQFSWLHSYARPAAPDPRLGKKDCEGDQNYRAGLVLHTDQYQRKKRKRVMKRCNKCVNCAERTDCGKCCFCLDMPKFGGAGIKKQKCLNRRCVKYGGFVVKEVVKTNSDEGKTQNIEKIEIVMSEVKVKKRKRRNWKRCENCTPCRRLEDCGECRFCRDKSKFGGPNTFRQKCLLRRCREYSSSRETGRGDGDLKSTGSCGDEVIILDDSKCKGSEEIPFHVVTHASRDTQPPTRKPEKKTSPKASANVGKKTKKKKRHSRGGCAAHKKMSCRKCHYRKNKPKSMCKQGYCKKRAIKKIGFCSKSCELRVLTEKVFEYLPRRIASWQRCGLIKGKWTTDLEAFCLEISKVRDKVNELNFRSEMMKKILTRARKAQGEMLQEKDEGDDQEYDDKDKPLVIGESNLAEFMRESGRNDETVEVVEQALGLKKLKKKKKLLCCCPLVANFFERASRYCPKPRDECLDHKGWEEMIKTQIELERIRGWLRVNRLLEWQRDLENVISE